MNIPYSLIRSDVLIPIIALIPDDTFAPNVAISGALAKTGAAISELPVPFEPRLMALRRSMTFQHSQMPSGP